MGGSFYPPYLATGYLSPGTSKSSAPNHLLPALSLSPLPSGSHKLRASAPRDCLLAVLRGPFPLFPSPLPPGVSVLLCSVSSALPARISLLKPGSEQAAPPAPPHLPSPQSVLLLSPPWCAHLPLPPQSSQQPTAVPPSPPLPHSPLPEGTFSPFPLPSRTHSSQKTKLKPPPSSNQLLPISKLALELMVHLGQLLSETHSISPTCPNNLLPPR